MSVRLSNILANLSVGIVTRCTRFGFWFLKLQGFYLVDGFGALLGLGKDYCCSPIWRLSSDYGERNRSCNSFSAIYI